jgi:serine/threonine protein kinase
MAADPRLLSRLILELLRSVALLSACGVVHSDLKTENILIRYD